MVIWTLVVGISLMVNGRIDMGAQVEAVYKTEKECRDIKKELDTNSTKAAKAGEINPTINSFGSVCVPVVLDIHAKPQALKGS